MQRTVDNASGRGERGRRQKNVFLQKRVAFQIKTRAFFSDNIAAEIYLQVNIDSFKNNKKPCALSLCFSPFLRLSLFNCIHSDSAPYDMLRLCEKHVSILLGIYGKSIANGNLLKNIFVINRHQMFSPSIINFYCCWKFGVYFKTFLKCGISVQCGSLFNVRQQTKHIMLHLNLNDYSNLILNYLKHRHRKKQRSSLDYRFRSPVSAWFR